MRCHFEIMNRLETMREDALGSGLKLTLETMTRAATNFWELGQCTDDLIEVRKQYLHCLFEMFLAKERFFRIFGVLDQTQPRPRSYLEPSLSSGEELITRVGKTDREAVGYLETSDLQAVLIKAFSGFRPEDARPGYLLVRKKSSNQVQLYCPIRFREEKAVEEKIVRVKVTMWYSYGGEKLFNIDCLSKDLVPIDKLAGEYFKTFYYGFCNALDDIREELGKDYELIVERYDAQKLESLKLKKGLDDLQKILERLSQDDKINTLKEKK